MTVFSSEQSTTTDGDQGKDYIADIVSEKGEQWKDPAVLAKGYATSQEYIAQLETELKVAKEANTKQDYMKEVLDSINAAKSPSAGATATQDTNNGGANTKEDHPSVSADQIKDLVKEALTLEELNRTSQQNLLETDKKLTELFGTEAANVVEKRGNELGMSKERLKQLAEESPTAFLSLMGAPSAKETNTTTTSTVNTTATSNHGSSNERNFRFYMDLKKSNPKEYRTATIQNQMLEDRLRLGDKFY